MRAIVGLGFVYLLLFITIIMELVSCTSIPKTNMSECKSLCAGERVELYKDELIECKCRGSSAATR